jgi:hypothetical protein
MLASESSPAGSASFASFSFLASSSSLPFLANYFFSFSFSALAYSSASASLATLESLAGFFNT